MQATKISQYRQRGYRSSKTGNVQIVYSNDAQPVNTGDETWTLEWDNQVTVTEVTAPTVLAS